MRNPSYVRATPARGTSVQLAAACLPPPPSFVPVGICFLRVGCQPGQPIKRGGAPLVQCGALRQGMDGFFGFAEFQQCQPEEVVGMRLPHFAGERVQSEFGRFGMPPLAPTHRCQSNLDGGIALIEAFRNPAKRAAQTAPAATAAE